MPLLYSLKGVCEIKMKKSSVVNLINILGLDPALPLFDEEHVTKRIAANDAGMVDCIHTCGGLLGFYTPICSHDFYPNGGSIAQPGCFFDIFGKCSRDNHSDYRFKSFRLVTKTCPLMTSCVLRQ